MMASSVRNFAFAAFVMVLAWVGSAMAQQWQEELYNTETIVTGTIEPERSRGFRIGVAQVLVKLTGEPRLVDTSGAVVLQSRAAELVTDFSYEDRMKDIPVHDEQGTRDRPHFLRIRFDPEKFDRALAEAGFQKWDGKRPTIAVWLGIRDMRSTYVLSMDGPGGYGQREVLRAASKLRGIPIILPPETQNEVSYTDIAGQNAARLRAASDRSGADATLYGLLEFDGDAYWNCRWSVVGDEIDLAWDMTGVTFDQALKEGIDAVMIAYAAKARQSKRQ